MTGITTPATGFLRSIPETARQVREDLEARRTRLQAELDAIEYDLTHVRAIEAAATPTPTRRLLGVA